MPKPTTDLKPKFELATRTHQAHELLLQGLTIQAIADSMGCTEENVRILLGKAMQRLTAEAQSMREQWETVTLHRTEALFNMIMRPLTRATEANPDIPPPKGMISEALQVLKFQREVLALGTASTKDDSKTVNNNLTINQTLVASSDLYTEALASAQQEFLGYYVADVEADRVIPSEDMLKLEAIAQKYAPEELERGSLEEVVVEDVYEQA